MFVLTCLSICFSRCFAVFGSESFLVFLLVVVAPVENAVAIVTTVVTGPLRLLLRQHRSNSIIGHGTFLIMRKGSYAELCLCTMARDLTTAPVQQEMTSCTKRSKKERNFRVLKLFPPQLLIGKSEITFRCTSGTQDP